jgi:hypothetical protein
VVNSWAAGDIEIGERSAEKLVSAPISFLAFRGAVAGTLASTAQLGVVFIADCTQAQFVGIRCCRHLGLQDGPALSRNVDEWRIVVWIDSNTGPL